MATKKKADEANTIILARKPRVVTRVRIEGKTPLIMHRQGAKAARMMLDKMQGAVVKKKDREQRNPVEDFLDSINRVNPYDRLEAFGEDGEVVTNWTTSDGDLDELMPVWARFKKPDNSGFGMPSAAFLQASVRAAKAEGLVMKDVTCALTVPRHYVQIESDPPQMRFDWVKVSMTTDLRFRAQFHEWSCWVAFEHQPHIIATDSILALVDAAGSIGVGEWRPERKGVFGQFRPTGEVQCVEVG